MFLVDTAAGRIVDDDEIKGELAAAAPVRGTGCTPAGCTWPTLPPRERALPPHEDILRRQQVFGYTEEELRVLLEPMAATGAEPTGSMGTDTPVAVLSRAAAAALRLLQPAVRPGHQPAAGRDPGGAGDLARLHDRAGRQPAGRGAGGRPQDRAAVPGAGQRRAGQAVRSPATPSLPGFAVTVRGLYEVDGGGAALADGAQRGSGPRSSPRSRPAPGSWCSPTAAATRGRRRSRRCC